MPALSFDEITKKVWREEDWKEEVPSLIPNVIHEECLKGLRAGGLFTNYFQKKPKKKEDKCFVFR